MPSNLRSRRKQETRERIATAALDLFLERGYDTVSVFEVSVAAGVTEKTVFNHFGIKAELVYANDLRFQDALVGAVAGRHTRPEITRALTDFLLHTYSSLLVDVEAQRRQRELAVLVGGSADLERREGEILDRYAVVLAGAIHGNLAADATDLRPQVMADALVSVHRRTVRELRRRALAAEAVEEFGPEVIDAARAAFTLLEEGLASNENG